MTDDTLLLIRREPYRYPFRVRPAFRPYNSPNEWHGVITLGRPLIRWRWNWLLRQREEE